MRRYFDRRGGDGGNRRPEQLPPGTMNNFPNFQFQENTSIFGVPIAPQFAPTHPNPFIHQNPTFLMQGGFDFNSPPIAFPHPSAFTWQNPTVPFQTPPFPTARHQRLVNNNFASGSGKNNSVEINTPSSTSSLPDPSVPVQTPPVPSEQRADNAASNSGNNNNVENPPSSTFPLQNPSVPLQTPQFPTAEQQLQQPTDVPKTKKKRKKIEAAVTKARKELIAKGESVSSWKVSRAALVELKAESWDSFGYQLQELPSLQRLVLMEEKINSFIHCYVAVLKITTLYDLEMAICESESIKNFEDLEMGPLVQHPLVKHYFSTEHMGDVYRITSEEIISYLPKFMETRKGSSQNEKQFLGFIAKERKVASWKKMGVRIQSLGMHISLISKALQSENSVLKMFCEEKKNNSSEKGKNSSCKRTFQEPSRFSQEKKQRDHRFKALTGRILSFTSATKAFQGNHIRFGSSSSGDDDDSYDDEDECDSVEKTVNGGKQKQYKHSSQKSGGDKVSSCPYPSAAEEITRLGLQGETVGSSSTKRRALRRKTKRLQEKKRKLNNLTSCTKEESRKTKRLQEKKRKLNNLTSCTKEESDVIVEEAPLSDDDVRMFISTWKEACSHHTAAEVFEQMLQFYNISRGHKKKLKSVVCTYIFQGLLNVAVLSMKIGHWDSMYDTLQSINDPGQASMQPRKYIDCEELDVGPSEKNHAISTSQSLEHSPGVTVEDIVGKIIEYFDVDSTLTGGSYSPSERIFVLVRELFNCEAWLSQQFSVKDFQSLGYGEYLTFIKGHISLLFKELQGFLNGKTPEHFYFGASMLRQQLVTLLAQASNSLWDDGCINNQRISALLLKQFPLISFNLIENGGLKDLQDTVNKHRSEILSKNVLFSATLSGMYNFGDSLTDNENNSLNSAGMRVEVDDKRVPKSSVTSKEAVEVLLKAPMLIDLNLWLHWDILYAPSLGPLMRWLLDDVNAKDLLCLVTKEGKIIKVDHSASVDSFFEALLQGSSFQVAVELLSLFALCGGKRHLPLSLLKCHARQAFDVLLRNSVDIQLKESLTSSIGVKSAHEIKLSKGLAFNSRNSDSSRRAVSVVSRLILDCLGYLPSEFHGFAAEVLLSGVQSLVKNAPEAVLLECKRKEEHLMLHELGFCLGIVEWIDDHQKHCPITDDDIRVPIQPLSSLGICSKSAELEYKSYTSDKLSFSVEKSILSGKEDGQSEGRTCSLSMVDGVQLEVDDSVRYGMQPVNETSQEKDAFLLIESIRREEFGLDSTVENELLNKQHARLGRALHCLSQELYSQDSHFILELIQNADDNVYSEHVEPTLIFILQETGIIILNNERGFTAQNIRALCDVGNSTKKGSSAGYIGKKGIGFKSVFRVTDAPEIHSNGFHIKFDISEGQIGFVLPTIVPPYDIDSVRHLVSPPCQMMDSNCWNTCIMLPFRSKVTQGFDIERIVCMLSDVHPSILLFVHRLQCIKLRNVLDDSFLVMRKEVVGDGLVRVSYGEKTMTWFIASKSLHPQVIRPDVRATEISVAFTLEESEDGVYEPLLEQQPVFAFLPLRTYGLKFILQGDFVLPSSREEVDEDSPWNQWLLSEFPSLFVGAEKSFCALPCFRGNIAKAVSVYMRFVPLIGEVHGFFSGLPRIIISKLRSSECLVQEGFQEAWVPPCKVLRNWNEQARMLLPEVSLREHLGLGFLDKDIILSDSLARALGVEEYGPKVLIQFMSSLSCVENGLKSMGLRWLCSWLSELYSLLHSSWKAVERLGSELDLIDTLKSLPFIPLFDGTYGALNEGAIWLETDFLGTGFGGDDGIKVFPNLYATLRIVNPNLFLAASDKANCVDMDLANNVTRLLHKVGVQNLNAHDIIKVHILPSISDEIIASKQKDLLIESTAFVMLHLQSDCPDCCVEKENILSEFKNKALVYTNYGCKRLKELPIHFGKEFGNSVVACQFLTDLDYEWHEIDVAYLKHPAIESMPSGLMKLREFFLTLGITDFVKVRPVEKNVSELSPGILQQLRWEGNLNLSNLVVTDWESEELACILSSLTRNSHPERSKYFLEVIDSLWDTYFIGKTTSHISCISGRNDISFKSSLMKNICSVKWVASSVDNELHYPNELFYDCDVVRSLFGASAPYSVPTIRNAKLLSDIGFKTQVTIDDILAVLKTWSKSDTLFKASISQMSRLYAFISAELATSREKIMEALSSGPFIFVPRTAGNNQEEVISGLFLSPEEVYWHDCTGALDSLNHPSFSTGENNSTIRLLRHIYPGLHHFFVHDCRVTEAPPFHCYLQILKQLSLDALPVRAANAVFQVFLWWADGLKSGAMGLDDITFLRNYLSLVEGSVLPALQDKWVSLNPSYGLVCWSDDDSLKKEFKHSENIEFLYFGELKDGKELLQTKVSFLLKELGIPAISEVVTREAIYEGLKDSSIEASKVAWALPFAQRYIFNVHPEKYDQLGYEKVQNLKVIVVDKLSYRNVIKKCSAASRKRFVCSCLLQDTILHIKHGSDSHSIFMELSRLFFDGDSELHLANFLHMLATMAESGSTTEQLEFFIVHSQKMLKVPDEPIWSLTLPSSEEEHQTQLDGSSTNAVQKNPLKSKKKPGISCWPPSDWKTAPGFDEARANGWTTQGPGATTAELGGKVNTNDSKPSDIKEPIAEALSPEIIEDIIMEENLEPLASSFTEDHMTTDSTGSLACQPDPNSSNKAQSSIDDLAAPFEIVVEASIPEDRRSKPRDLNEPITVSAQQAMFAGKLGEAVAFKYFKDKDKNSIVKWVNEESETGFPYDIVIHGENDREFIEVKATRYASKNWFGISTREWQFAVDNGDRFSIAHVVLSNKNAAKIKIYKNPLKLCQQGKLQLAVMAPKLNRNAD